MNAISARTALVAMALMVFTMATALGADLRGSLNGDSVSPGDSEVAYTFVYSIWGQPDFATGEQQTGAKLAKQASGETRYNTSYASFPTFSTRATDYWFTNVADASPVWLAYLRNTVFAPTPMTETMPMTGAPQTGSGSGTPLWALMDGYASPQMSAAASATGQTAPFSFDTSLGTFPVATSSSTADAALAAQGLLGSGSGDIGNGDFSSATGFVGTLGLSGSSSTGSGTNNGSGGSGTGGTGSGGSGDPSGGFNPTWPAGGGGSSSGQPTNTSGNDNTGGSGSTPEAATILLLFATALPYVGHKLRHRHDDGE
jgi:hypothetical protein